ncbi:Uncharacterized protein FWK35_00021203, partial [Aphis craccivora]
FVMYESVTLSLTGNATILSVNYFPSINLYDDSEIALLCLQSFNSFPNINENNNKFSLQIVDDENNNTPMMCYIKLEEGCYEIKDRRVKKQIDDYNSENLTKLTFDISVDPNDFRSYIKCNGILHFEIPFSMAPVFGLKKDNINQIMCNIAQGSFNNHLQSHSIYEFFPNGRTGSKVIQSPPNLLYYKLNKINIDSITVQLVDQDHNPIDNFANRCLSVSTRKLYFSGRNVSEPVKVKLSSNGYSYLFEQIRLEINGIEIDSMRVLGITSSLKGYLSGTPDNYNCYENSGWNFKNATQSANDKELIITRNHSDLNALKVVTSGSTSSGKVVLNKIDWNVPHITVDDEERLKLLKLIEKEKSLFIPFRSFETFEYPELGTTKKVV